MDTETLSLTYHHNNTIALITLKQVAIDKKQIRDYNTALDIILAREGPLCLITTSNHKKIFSAGFDFEAFTQHIDDVANFISESSILIGRLLALPIPSIAAISMDTH